MTPKDEFIGGQLEEENEVQIRLTCEVPNQESSDESIDDVTSIPLMRESRVAKKI